MNRFVTEVLLRKVVVREKRRSLSTVTHQQLRETYCRDLFCELGVISSFCSSLVFFLISNQ